MNNNRLRPLEKIARTMAVRLGVIEPDATRLDPLTSSAIYLARLDMKEYIETIIGDDLSPAAQKIRAALRKM